MQYKYLSKEETDVVVAVLRSINLELDRCYWNEHQEYMDSHLQILVQHISAMRLPCILMSGLMIIKITLSTQKMICT